MAGVLSRAPATGFLTGLIVTPRIDFRGRRVDRYDAARIELLAAKPLVQAFACGLRLGIQESRFFDSDTRRHGVPWADVGAPPLAEADRPRLRHRA